MSGHVEIIDVAPRDGLQNEANLIATDDKLKLISLLAAAGIPAIQATSFVHPKWVPQMADAAEVVTALTPFERVRFSALVPNLRGYERAVAAGLRRVDFVVSASESFNHKNLNCSIAESIATLGAVQEAAKRDGVSLRVDISTSFHCPFEGRTPISAVVDVVRAVRDCGVEHIALDDTDGMAFPDQVIEAVSAVREQLGVDPGDLILHLHDTYGRGLANAVAALEAGVRAFDASVGGLGGCPFSPGSSGNLATEDLLDLLAGLGYVTGVDAEQLLDAAQFAHHLSSRPYSGHLLRVRRPLTVAPAPSAGT